MALPSSSVKMNTEIRFLPPSLRLPLAQILSAEDQWKVLMAAIPRSKEDRTNKYTTDHVRLIEQASQRTGKPGMDILIDEWGTSGKARPTVEDLLKLCYEEDLIRAADFVRNDILGGDVMFDLNNWQNGSSEGEVTSQISIQNNVIVNKTPPYVNFAVNKNPHEDVTRLVSDSPVDVLRAVIEPTGTRKMVDFRTATQEQLNECLSSLLISADDQSIRDIPEDISLIQSTLPQFSYSFLQTITNNFSNIPYSRGGSRIGEGAFGSVYFGRLSGQLGLENKAIAVKRLNRGTVKVEEQFNYEVEVMGYVEHPNLLRLIAYSNDGDELCLLYPFMENGSLEERLALVTGKPPLLPMQRLKIAYGASEGIKYLHNSSHTKPLVHRDIKTANILLDGQLEPKIGDFGLVRLGSGGTDGGMTCMTTTVMGTTAYMAPEAVRGVVSVKMDVFSFGVVLLELLTGLMPWDENRENTDLITHIQEVVDSDIHPHLDQAVPLAEWRQVSPQAIYDQAQACIELRKNKRPFINSVCEALYSLF